ncbi:hypothetical protein TNCT_185831 [Trichonephila clavata]|uniref:Uncharacterized protein n=1 Tax=Trichonephila clavata TaxID=2740835 RepID=A0A8X6GUH6_TRICU|nr:hypothetical protein TNCT_185831 [Trichonephila clavata]
MSDKYNALPDNSTETKQHRLWMPTKRARKVILTICWWIYTRERTKNIGSEKVCSLIPMEFIDLCTDKMKNVKKHYHLLKLLLTASPAQKRAIIRTADKSQLHLFCEICLKYSRRQPCCRCEETEEI